MEIIDYGDCWVCDDCYTAHHYGAHQETHEVVIWDDDKRESVEREVELWFAGEDDEPVGGWYRIRSMHTLSDNREPLGLIEDDVDVTDNTCSDHYYGQDVDPSDDGEVPCDQCGQTGWENGIQEFSFYRCEGCGSPLGGARYRLHLFKRERSDA